MIYETIIRQIYRGTGVEIYEEQFAQKHPELVAEWSERNLPADNRCRYLMVLRNWYGGKGHVGMNIGPA